jgi:hypothetical protein
MWWQLEESEWVAVALADDLLADGSVERAVQILQQQRACVAFSQTAHRQFREAAEGSPPISVRAAQTRAILSARRRRPTKRRICADAASSHCASSITHSSGCCSATSASKVSVASATRKRVGGFARPQAEDRSQRIALRGRQLIEVIQHRRTELVQPAVGELHLRFDPDRGCDAPAVSPLDREAEERALADAGLAAEHDDSAPTAERVGQRRVKKLALGTSPTQPHRQPRLPRTSSR